MQKCSEDRTGSAKNSRDNTEASKAFWREWELYTLDEFEEIIAFYLGAKTGPEPIQGTPATIDMAIYSLTPEGKFTDISRAGVKMLGYASKEEVLKEARIRDLLFSEEDAARITEIINREGYVRDYEVLLRKRDGEKLNAIVTGRALHDETGKICAYRGMIRDITSQRRLEEFNQALETIVSERTTSTLALTLADKVRNPATVIGLLSKKLAEGELPGTVKETILTIRSEAAKLDEIVGNFQSIVRDRHSVFNYEDVNERLRSIVLLVEKEADRKGVKLISDLSENALRINMQRDLWSAALLQLARNAIEATPSGGQITVSTYVEEDNVIIAVSDTGSGIPEDEIEKMFEPLVTTKPHRYGMGLPLVKQVVSEHMGTIHLESKEGEGTRFRMGFPKRWR